MTEGCVFNDTESTREPVGFAGDGGKSGVVVGERCCCDAEKNADSNALAVFETGFATGAATTAAAAHRCQSATGRFNLLLRSLVAGCTKIC